MVKSDNLFRATLLGVLVLSMWNASADDYSDGWGPAVGSPMPLLAASDQSGVVRNLENLTGDHGLLLFLNRSADW